MSKKVYEAYEEALKLLSKIGADRSVEAWLCSADALRTVNAAVVSALETGDYDTDQEMVFTDIPAQYTGKNVSGACLTMCLTKDSPLAREVTTLLKKHLGGQAE